MTVYDTKQVALEQETPQGRLPREEGANSSKEGNSSSSNTKFAERTWVVFLGEIGIPLFAAIAAAGIAGWFTLNQTNIAEKREANNSVSEATKNRGEVLTTYAKTISDLMAAKEGNNFVPNKIEKDIIRGHTLVALRRLNPQDKFQENPDDESGSFPSLSLSGLFESNSDEEDKKLQDDAGELKGYLIRYLYDLDLLRTRYYQNDEIKEAEIDLGGADLDNVVLKDASLWNIALKRAYLRKGDFRNANLEGANLTEANLTEANLTEANLTEANLTEASLSFPKQPLSEIKKVVADLTGVKLSGANLTGANLTGANLTEADFSPHISLDSEVTEFTETELFEILSNLKKSDRDDVLAELEETKRSAVESYLSLETSSEEVNSPEADTNEDKIREFLNNFTEGEFEDSNLSEMLTKLGEILTVELDITWTTLEAVNLSSADLRRANLSFVDLTDANLEGACYVEGAEDTKGTLFPDGFDPAAVGMVAISANQSDPSEREFRACTSL
ncbi:putative low-complexity protein [Leptolyngbya sp. PCC 7375]|nr:putative low-complexity protein [Leptolyngbya sp. PCC 7375]